jgi:hypothetical protein
MTEDDENADDQEHEEQDEEVVGWPVKGPATGQQAIVAIAFVFFLGVVIGFLLCRTF